MNKRIRRLGIFLLGCYVALFAMLNYIQVLEADPTAVPVRGWQRMSDALGLR